MKEKPKIDNPWRRRFLALLGATTAWLPFFWALDRSRHTRTSLREADWYRRGDGSE